MAGEYHRAYVARHGGHRKAEKVDLGKKGSFEIKKPGDLHRRLNVPQGERIPESKIKSAEHSKDPETRREAVSAEGLKHMHHGGK